MLKDELTEQEYQEYMESVDWYDKLVKDPSLDREPQEAFKLPEY